MAIKRKSCQCKQIVVVILLCLFAKRNVNCSKHLKYYETLTDIGVTTRVTRQAGVQELLKHVKFKAFERVFTLTLKSGTDVLASGFRAQLVQKDGRMTTFFVDQSKIFTGHLTDQTDVQVNAHLEDTLWSIRIYEKNETFGIEPARNLLKPPENPRNDTLIAYRSSDFSNNTGNCGTDNFVSPIYFDETNLFSYTGLRGRTKRENSRNTCLIYLVADFSFFENRCKRHHLTCSALMISLVHHVDAIFRKSKFQDSSFTIHTGIGIQIGMLVLYTAYTYSADTIHPHFNAKGISWTAYTKLFSFSYFMSYIREKYCLCHLLTSHGMSSRILGLAYGNSICSSPRRGNTLESCGLSSDMDELFGPLSSVQLNLVMTHEIGHNFGSGHDPHNKQCSHQDNQGGNYIMWERAVSGKSPNNLIFSPCSLRNIGRKVETVTCLISRKLFSTFCGNGIVDPGEECDSGAIGIVNADNCCSKYCTFIEWANCSDINTECCSNCRIAKITDMCFDNGGVDCKKKSYCTGTGFKCRTPENVPDGTPCLDGGQCYHGDCKGFCEIKGLQEGLPLKPCFCHATNISACQLCCFNASDPKNPGDCVPHTTAILKDGRPCYAGFCEGGLCTPVYAKTIFWVHPYWDTMNERGFVKFMKTNIVLATIICSLLVFIPFGCTFHHWEHGQRKKEELEAQMMKRIIPQKSLRVKQKVFPSIDTENHQNGARSILIYEVKHPAAYGEYAELLKQAMDSSNSVDSISQAGSSFTTVLYVEPQIIRASTGPPPSSKSATKTSTRTSVAESLLSKSPAASQVSSKKDPEKYIAYRPFESFSSFSTFLGRHIDGSLASSDVTLPSLKPFPGKEYTLPESRLMGNVSQASSNVTLPGGKPHAGRDSAGRDSRESKGSRVDTKMPPILRFSTGTRRDSIADKTVNFEKAPENSDQGQTSK